MASVPMSSATCSMACESAANVGLVAISRSVRTVAEVMTSGSPAESRPRWAMCTFGCGPFGLV